LFKASIIHQFFVNEWIIDFQNGFQTDSFGVNEWINYEFWNKWNITFFEVCKDHGHNYLSNCHFFLRQENDILNKLC